MMKIRNKLNDSSQNNSWQNFFPTFQTRDPNYVKFATGCKMPAQKLDKLNTI